MSDEPTNGESTDEPVVEGVKMHPSFRMEDQEMAEELKPVVVAPPAYTSPDPNTLAGGLVPVEQSELELGESYGADVENPHLVDVETGEPMSATGPDGEDREEWTKDQWQERAEELGVAKSGSKDEVRARVEEAEASEAEATDDEG